jgi:dienelactone hydrolase
MTNQPHREFLYRAAYELGRHIIGYEVQKALAAVDWFIRSSPRRPVGVIGYGEGGLIAFYAAASDTRIDAAVVSGYFQRREGLWQEPIYRNVFSLLSEFGDAEIVSLIAPRPVVIEACRHPEIGGPPQETNDRKGAAPGKLTTPPLDALEAEYRRALHLLAELKPPPSITLVPSGDGSGLPGCDAALRAFLRGLAGIDYQPSPPTDLPPPSLPANWPNREARLRSQFEEILEHTQHLMREAEFVRRQFWSKADASSVETWQESSRRYRDYLLDEIIGRLPPATLPPNPRTRRIYETPRFTGYEVVLDVYEDVFAYGILLLPRDIRLGERRPVVVCQHGLEGRPQDAADPDVDNHYYHRFACRLAERGFIAYAPQNPYIGGNNFRQIQRKANPLKGSLYGMIVRQHEQTLRWLSSLPYVDPGRVAFYGLSYGGKTAMRIPALLEGYCLVICSADYNEWIWKNVSVKHFYSYLISGEYEMPEFNLGNTFNYAELSWLIFPRPFMVERGHSDPVAPDEWVAYEYAKTRRHYVMLGMGEHTGIEFFNGPHTINGAGTFDFLERFLKKH